MVDRQVVPIRPSVSVPEPEQAPPHPSVVAFLESLLEKAREGEVQGIACAYHDEGWNASYALIGSVGGFSMQGAVNCLATNLAHINMYSEEHHGD